MSVNAVEQRAAHQGDVLPVAKVPPCDVCAAHADKEVQPAVANARVASGDWLNLCTMDLFLFGPARMGTGYGQKLVPTTGAKPAPKAAYAPEPAEAPTPPPRARAATPPAKAAEPAPQDNGARKLTGAARKAAANKAPAPAPEPEQPKALDPDVAAIKAKRQQRAAEAAAEAEPEPDAPTGPPPGHVQQPGTKWTPSDPQQVVAPPLHEVVAENVARAKAEREATPEQAAPAADPAPAPAEADTTKEGTDK